METGETVAIKKVLQDKRYKNRELQTMQLLDHPNVVQLKHHFFSTTEKGEVYLNLVLEYVAETVYRVAKYYNRMNQRVPILYVKLYAYQVREDVPLQCIYSFEQLVSVILKKLFVVPSFHRCAGPLHISTVLLGYAIEILSHKIYW